MRATRWAGLVVVGIVAGAVGCTYAPDPASGTLRCSVGAQLCPDGYTCEKTSDLCFKDSDVGGAGTTGTSGTTGGAGTTGAGGTTGVPCAGSCTIKINGTLTNQSAASTDKLIGRWTYDTGSTEVRTCTDGSDRTNALAGDYVDVSRTNGNLTGSYYCDWTLTTGPGGNATVILAGQSCSRNMTDAATGTTKYTWHGATFTFTSTDGKMATLVSTIAADYVYDSTKTGCTP